MQLCQHMYVVKDWKKLLIINFVLDVEQWVFVFLLVMKFSNFFTWSSLSVKILEWGYFQIGKGFQCGKTKKYKCLLQADIIALYLYIYAQSLSCIQLFVTLWTVALQAPLSMGFSRQEFWSGLPSSPPEDLPNPGIDPSLSYLLHWQAGSLPLTPSGRPYISVSTFFFLLCPKWVCRAGLIKTLISISRHSFYSAKNKCTFSIFGKTQPLCVTQCESEYILLHVI